MAMDKVTFLQKARLLQPRYTPSQTVKDQLEAVDLIVAVGPTGVGKSSILEHSGIHYITSDVTRTPRKDEDNGVDYNFRTDYDALYNEIENGEFVQFVIYQTGEFYGTKASSFPASGPCTMAVIATAIPLFMSLGFHRVLPVYIIPPDYKSWMKRLGDMRHGELGPRLVEAKVSIETALANNNFHFMVNEDLITAARVFHDIAYDKIEDKDAQINARYIALRLLSQIDSNTPPQLDGLV